MPASPIPDADLAAVARFCEGRNYPEHLDVMRVEFETRGRSITIVDCRAPWRPDPGAEWTRGKVAQLRLDPATALWTLYWIDSNERWHVSDDARPSARISTLLTAIERDRTSIFWG